MKTIVLAVALVVVSSTAWAVPSLQEQRRQRELAEQRSHEIKIERIRAQAAIEIAKQLRRSGRCWDDRLNIYVTR